ncbi:hypothetical protein SLEP1_g21767 [Rubroshorea leprosula]|uniref:BSD domain-containing protein n=1 Tax=Rubroshorea leprosula TaxID=152421 RepID=A0AAV5JD64_9ROSI|nr:hypothetical protein SLEP1_g21767 [Rubroshorea leprosula]
MSWLARSIADSLLLDDEESESAGYNDVAANTSSSTLRDEIQCQETGSPLLSPEQVAELRGVKEDLTELKQSLTRQLWGVATFLAPPPEHLDHQFDDRLSSDLNRSQQSDQSGEQEELVDSAGAGIRSDFVDIGGNLSKMASGYFPFGSRENGEGNEEGNEEEENEEFSAVGITDEVLAFASNIAHHPETWLDFPLDPDEDLDDFIMSDAQREHALIIQHLSPRLAALRIELCPCHMSESYFWKVYFVLLHSRLDKEDAEVLSTPQIIEARAMWMKELQKQIKPETDWDGRSDSCLRDSSLLHEDLLPASSSYSALETMSPRTYNSEPTSSITTEYETVKHPVENTEMLFVDKSIIEEKPVSRIEEKGLLVGPSSKIVIPNFEEEDDDDDWPEEEGLEFGGSAAIFVGNEEDISFSDLEDDDVLLKSKIVSKSIETSQT